MQEVFKNIIENLNEERACYFLTIANTGDKSLDVAYEKVSKALDKAIKIVKQTAEQFDMEREKVINELLKGEWVNTEDMEKYLNIGFSEGMKMFEFSRTAEWNPEPLNGQKITTEFRLKNDWIPCSERLPERNKPVLCWVRSTTIASGETYIIGSCDNGFWFLQTYEIGHHHFPVKDYEVLAWQPLPEPYTKGE